IILSFLLQINVIFYYFLISKSLYIDIPFILFFILIPVILTITMLPISIYGIGVREGSFVLLFSKFGIPPEVAFSLSVLAYLISVLFNSIGGIFFILQKEK
ncbi:MAG: lysylphosphatidylglycerol synthase domain-containing protein, partial [Acidobacteriota bacterium]